MCAPKKVVYSRSTWRNQQVYKVSSLSDSKIAFSVADWHFWDLKYNQGHWKWYEWVKLNQYYHNAVFDIYQICSVRENHNVKVFLHIQTISQRGTLMFDDIFRVSQKSM